VSPPPPAVDHFGLAVKYHGLGNFAQALTHYEAVLLEDEFNVEARNNLGLLYHERGLTAQYLRARGNLAVVLMNAGRLAEARAELRAALAIDPRNADLLVNMALVEKADEQPDAAIELLLRALGEQPFHAAAHYNLAVLYDEAGERGRAQDHYNDFLAHGGPEHGERLSAVKRRVEELAPDLPR
jgi:tetratricopeptide (TPR) repeat protein